MKKNRCLFCGNPAVLLCDGYLGFPLKVSYRNEGIDILRPYTCDAPMCEQCATRQANMHVCARGRGGCRVETIDHCPICIIRLPPYPKHTHRIIHSTEQAETIRRAHWNSYSNSYQKQLRLEQGGGQLCLNL